MIVYIFLLNLIRRGLVHVPIPRYFGKRGMTGFSGGPRRSWSRSRSRFPTSENIMDNLDAYHISFVRLYLSPYPSILTNLVSVPTLPNFDFDLDLIFPAIILILVAFPSELW